MTYQDITIITDRFYEDLSASELFVQNLPYVYTSRQNLRDFLDHLTDLGRSIDGLTRSYGVPACIYELREMFKSVVLNLKHMQDHKMIRTEPCGWIWSDGSYRN